MHDLPANRIEQVFAQALELDDAARSGFVDSLAANEPQLAAQLRVLLAADAQPTISPLRAAPLQMVIGDARPAWDQEPPPSQIGPYLLLEQVGRGGFGAVYKARQSDPVERIVAIKLILPGLASPDAMRRFMRERRTLALLEHPNIARLLEAGQTPTGRPYVVMEFVDGPTLSEYCTTRQLTAEARLELFLQACDAISHAHQRAVIHRDIKQSNLLVAQNADGAAIAKVIDFGIADFLRTEQDDRTRITAAGQFVGTPEYMSPEQLVGGEKSPDVRAEVYSLGIVMYELLTGVLPYTREQALAVSLSGESSRLPEATRPSSRVTSWGEVSEPLRRSMVSRLKRDLDWIVLKALAHDPAMRYATVSELAADIRRHLSDQAILARAPTTRDRIRRMYRRNPTALFATVAAVLLLIAGTIGSTIGLLSARQATRNATTASIAAKKGEKIAEQALALAEQRRKESEFAAYSASLTSAAAAIESPRSGPAMQRLLAVPSADRGWEWRAIAARADTADRVMRFPLSEIQHLRSQTNGTLLAACLNQQGTGEVVLIDTTDWSIRWRTKLFRPRSTEFSRDGGYLYVASDRLYLLDLGTGVAKPVAAETGPLSDVQLSPDGNTLAAIQDVGAASQVILIDPSGLIARKLPVSGFMEVAWSPDSQLLASGSTTGQLTVWSERENRVVFSEQPSRDLISALSFSHDGRVLAVGERQGALRLLKTTDWSQVSTFNSLSTGTFRLAFSSDDHKLAITGLDGFLGLLDIEKLNSPRDNPLRVLRGHALPVHALAYASDGKTLYSGSYDGSLRIWSVESAGSAPARWGPTLCFSRDGKTYAVSNASRGLDIVSLDGTHSRQSVSLLPLSGRAEFGRDDSEMVFKASNQIMSVSLKDGVIRERVRLASDRAAEVRSVSPDGRLVALWVHFHGTLVADLDNGTTIWGEKVAQAGETIGFLSDDQLLSVGLNGDLESWSPREDRLLMRYGHTGDAKFYTAALSKDRQFLVAAAFDSTLTVFETATGRQISRSKPMSGFLGSLMLTPDGSRAITLGEDGIVKCFELPTLRFICGIRACSIWARGALSPDGELMLIYGTDHSLQEWRVPSSSLHTK